MLASLGAFVGVGLFALPAGILGAGFTECYADVKKRREERRRRRHLRQGQARQGNRAASGNGTDFENLSEVEEDLEPQEALLEGRDTRLTSVVSSSSAPYPAPSETNTLDELIDAGIDAGSYSPANDRFEALEKAVGELVKTAQRQEEMLVQQRELLQSIADKILVSSY